MRTHGGTGESCIDENDTDYVVADAKLQPLLQKGTRVKLLKLERYV